MLTLSHITKDYIAGESVVSALKGIDLQLRDSEFVSILGPSGCGKTTLLNIIGGLDQYTSGEMQVNGVPTHHFKDADWDAYRNHSVGFVFQNYNLIPHQNVLSNVELALTLSGVSKSERKKRAVKALQDVGLGDQVRKKPNQLSGGQMQRVAIARALVNDPAILLCDEPTGALDSETSIQVMEALKSISDKKLVVMVTHNPELAERYSTRIIKLLDGKIIDDSRPLSGDELKPDAAQRGISASRASMSFGTALGLSVNNLLTKKARTILTAFAGSIGIIGIALILSVSTGVQNYINRVQEDTLSSYPIELRAESLDMSGILSTLMDLRHEERTAEHEPGTVAVNSVVYDMMNSMNVDTAKNNLKAFSDYIDVTPDFQKYASSIQYSYDTNMNIMVRNKEGDIVKSDIMDLFSTMYASFGMSIPQSAMTGMNRMQVWEELLPGKKAGELIDPLIYNQYDLVYGHWPEKANELLLVVDRHDEISDMTLYALGLRTGEELMNSVITAQRGEMIDKDDLQLVWTYEDLCGISLRYIAPADMYQRQEDGTYVDLGATAAGLSMLYDSDAALKLDIVGVIRPSGDAVSSMLGGSLAYTTALTDYMLAHTAEHELVRAQLEDPATDALSGLPFEGNAAADDPAAKRSRVTSALEKLDEGERAAIYADLALQPDEAAMAEAAESYMSQSDPDELIDSLISGYAEQAGISETFVRRYIDSMSETARAEALRGVILDTVTQEYTAQTQARLDGMTDAQKSAALSGLALTDEQVEALFGRLNLATVSASTYEGNLRALGYIDPDSPSSIRLFAATFADKDALNRLIEAYNDSADEDDRINYTDYVALMMSSVSTIINAVSYVLIAFVAISLIVSSIMIGIITYISVLERTKEIGILRAIGASKRDIRRVFNAETLTIGFFAGGFGIGITLLLTIPINIILHKLTDISILSAQLPAGGAVALVIISMLLTYIAGLIPSGIAARKDPVIALRTE